jgi:uroporphyrinogen-III decarboxylase
MMAAIRGEPFDKYPFVNPYPTWSMMPHWPEMLGLTFLHLDYGSDDERLRCYGAFHEILGLDWMPLPWGPTGQDKRYRIESQRGVPVLVDIEAGKHTRFEEFPKDYPVTKPRYTSAREVEALPAPMTAEDQFVEASAGMAGKVVESFGREVFLMSGVAGPFGYCYYQLGFDKLYDALIHDASLLDALLERQTEAIARHARACARLGVHGVRINDFPCGGELVSEEHYLRFVFPYEQRAIRAIRDAGLVAILEYLGWIEPRLKHFARLEVDCLQTESSLKGYRNDVGEYRKALGEEVCIFGNPRIRDVIELGDEEVWRRSAIEQARGVGEQRRYAICAGSPTTWATGPERLRRFSEFTRRVLAEIVPPLGPSKETQ